MPRFGILMAALFAMLTFSVASAQGNASQGERQQQISKLVEDMNGPDPAIRISAFEAAIGSRDQNLRSLAIQSALASKEQVLREAALRAALTGRRSIALDLSLRPQDAGNKNAIAASDAIGGRLEVYIFSFEPASGAFLAATPYTSGEGDARNFRFNAGQGTLIGDRVSMSFDTDANTYGRSPWTFRPVNSDGRPAASNDRVQQCKANLRLSDSTLRGQLSCTWNGAPFSFLASASVMN